MGKRTLAFLSVFLAPLICALLYHWIFYSFPPEDTKAISSSGNISALSPRIENSSASAFHVAQTSGTIELTQRVQAGSDSVAATQTAVPLYGTSKQKTFIYQNQAPDIGPTPLQLWFDAETARYTIAMRAALLVPRDNNGILLSATSFPFAGRLLRRPRDGGDISTCSGALIGPRHFITAAHCFCEKDKDHHWPNYRTCTNLGAPEKSTTVVSFPAAGAYSDIRKITINPNYRAIDPKEVDTDDPQPPLADIAIVELDDDVPLPALSLDEPGADDTPIAAGFGALDLTRKAKKKIGINGGPYSPGIEAIFFPLLQSCADHLTQEDVVCANYSSFNLAPGSATCGGDSGAALFKKAANGRTFLVGIASSRISHKDDPLCLADDSVLSVFTDVAIYRDWIRQVMTIDQRSSTQNRIEGCTETLTSWDAAQGGSLDIRNRDTVAHISVTAAGFSGEENQPGLFATPSDYCEHTLDHQALLSCKLPANANLVVQTTGNGILQIASCHQRNPGGPK